MKKILIIICLLCLPFSAFANDIKPLNSSEFLSLLTKEKDKVIIVNFFASWCPPCIIETPDFVKIRSDYPQNDVLIIGLSVDEDIKELQNFIDKHSINYPIYMPSKDLIAAYRVSAIPHTIIYAKNLKQIYSKANILNYSTIKKFIDM